MNEHIAYAMRNEVDKKSWISFNSPSELLDWSHLAIDVLILIGFLLALAHAWKTYKNSGSPSALLTLLSCVLYGLFMDILSYYTVENFWHGEFSVMLLFNKLPLYIVCLYPAIIYHSIMTIKRYDFSRLTESILSGFLSGFLYMIFDNFGPMVGWWIWDITDPTTFPYVSSVPLTSYAWMFLFTTAFTFINRAICWNWVEKGVSKFKIALAIIFMPIATVFCGVILFIPQNLFAKSSPPYQMLIPWEDNVQMAALVYVVMFTSAGWLFLMKWRKPKYKRDSLLMAFPFIYLTAFAYMYISKFHLFFNVTEQGLSQGLVVGNIFAIIFALIISSLIILKSHPVPKEE
jgi:hypothetical protein